jgi:hypothetical protein
MRLGVQATAAGRFLHDSHGFYIVRAGVVLIGAQGSKGAWEGMNDENNEEVTFGEILFALTLAFPGTFLGLLFFGFMWFVLDLIGVAK